MRHLSWHDFDQAVERIAKRTGERRFSGIHGIPRGDKRNTPFFEEHLLRVYERRASSGLDQLVGPMAALVVQVDHGHLFD